MTGRRAQIGSHAGLVGVVHPGDEPGTWRIDTPDGVTHVVRVRPVILFTDADVRRAERWFRGDVASLLRQRHSRVPDQDLVAAVCMAIHRVKGCP